MNHTATIKQINTATGYRAVLILLSVLSALINIFIITKYMVNVHRTKKFPNYLLCCVAISDLFIVLLAAFLLVVSYTQHLALSGTLCLLQYALFDYSFTMYLCTIMVCVFDRYLCIAKPLLYRTLSTKGGAKGVIVLVWLVSCVPPLVHVNLCEFEYQNILSDMDGMFYLYFKGTLLGLSFVVVVMLIVTCAKIKNHLLLQTRRRRRGVQQQPSVVADNEQQKEQQQPEQAQQCKEQELQQQHYHQDKNLWHCTSADKWTKRRQRRVTIASICMTIAFTVTFLPTTVTYFCHSLGLLRKLTDASMRMLVDTTTMLYLCTSFIDPCLTLLLKKEIRHGVDSLRKTFTVKRSLDGPHILGTMFVNRVAPAVSKVTLVATLSDSSIPIVQ